jgi:hypothetical protein
MHLTSRINVLALVSLLLFSLSAAAQPQAKKKNPLNYEQVEEMVRNRVGLAIIRQAIETEGVNFVSSPVQNAALTKLNPIAAETIIAAIRNNLTYTIRIECRPDCDLVIGEKRTRTQNGVYESETTAPEISVTASRPAWFAGARLTWENPVRKWDAVIYRLSCAAPGCEIYVDDGGQKPPVRSQQYEYATDSGTIKAWATAPGHKESDHIEITSANPTPPAFVLARLPYRVSVSCKPVDCRFLIPEGNQAKPPVAQEDGKYSFETALESVEVEARNDRQQSQTFKLTPKTPDHVFDFGPIVYSLGCVERGAPVECDVRVVDLGASQVIKKEFRTYSTSVYVQPLLPKGYSEPTDGFTVDGRNPLRRFELSRPAITYSSRCLTAPQGPATDCPITFVDGSITKTVASKAGGFAEFTSSSPSVTARPAAADTEAVVILAANPKHEFVLTPKAPSTVYVLGCMEAGRPVDCDIKIVEAGRPEFTLKVSSQRRTEYETTATSISARPVLNESVYSPYAAVPVPASNPRYDFLLNRLSPSPQDVFNSIRAAVGKLPDDMPRLAKGRSAVSLKDAITYYALTDSALGSRSVRWDFLGNRQSVTSKVDYFTLGRSAEPASSVVVFAKVEPKASWWKLVQPDAALSASLTEYAAARPIVLLPSLKDPKLELKVENNEKTLRVQQGADIYLITYNAESLPQRIQHRSQPVNAAGPEKPIADIRYQNYGDIGGARVPYQIEIRIADRPGFVQTICVDTYFVWPGAAANDRAATVSKYAFAETDKSFINGLTIKTPVKEYPQRAACTGSVK